MYRLSSIIVLLLGTLTVFAQSPHGAELKMDCKVCHTPKGWDIDNDYIKFDHSKTDFDLEGTHSKTECIACHTSLVFDQAPNQCISCHDDIHSMSVGNDCVRCHTSTTWIVDMIPELHEENGFPLIASHGVLSCDDCHTSSNVLKFERVGNECIGCHNEDFLTAQNPTHDNYPTDCMECHSPLGTGWNSFSTNHDFFPLTMGHEINDCTQCHTSGNYNDLSDDCASCHQTDYNATTLPNHANAGFSADCASCHTTNLGWTPATIEHDFFPLTQGHSTPICTECHTTSNYADTSPECIDCHQTTYTATSNPNHSSVGFSTDCIQCHTTDPGWTPATIEHDFFPLTGGHSTPDCTECHTTGNYADASPRMY